MTLLEKGQKVFVKNSFNGGKEKIGQIVEIDDQDSEMPYFVQYNDGTKYWEYVDEVELYDPRRNVYLA